MRLATRRIQIPLAPERAPRPQKIATHPTLGGVLVLSMPLTLRCSRSHCTNRRRRVSSTCQTGLEPKSSRNRARLYGYRSHVNASFRSLARSSVLAWRVVCRSSFSLRVQRVRRRSSCGIRCLGHSWPACSRRSESIFNGQEHDCPKRESNW